MSFPKIVSAFAAGCMLLATQATAAPIVSKLVMKVSDAAPGGLDPYLGWVNAGGFNMGVSGSTALTNNGIDFKDSFVDTNWADVLTVRVSMYSGGNEAAFIEFDAAGTTKTNFFTQSNVTSSTWSDVAGTGNYFSIQGHDAIDRHWFINNNYGGCGADVGHMVVLDGSAGVCSWETSRSGAGIGTRALLYSTASTEVNWNTANVGVADVYAVHVTTEAAVDLPPAASLGLAGAGVFGLLAIRRRAGKTTA